jgi:type VI secretion system protein ImpH
VAGARWRAGVAVSGRSPLERLLAEPRRFSFDAAVRLLGTARRRTGGAALRFRANPGLGYPATEVTAVEAGDAAAAPAVEIALFGLTGASGVLPRHYTDAVLVGLRSRSRAMHDFFGVLSQAITTFFAAAGTKYRLHRAADVAADVGGESAGPVAAALLALTGQGTSRLADRLAPGAAPLQHYAGLFSARPRSADRLAALVSDWLARPVEVEQFVGAWLPLPPDQRTALARGLQLGPFSRLSVDAAAGVRAWDQQARIVLRIGPLDGETFRSLLPDRPALKRLVGLVGAYIGHEVGFSINPVLARDAVRPITLGPDASGDRVRLGWNSWMPSPGAPRQADAADALFPGERVDALPA